ncbi:MAG TPA: metalloregulator ArsR/SmtB family transcription factor [Roseiflexaceae bacterium]|jgi:ArsR family transcriptional regulator
MNQALHRFKAEFFKALGHPARLVILEQLRSGEKSVNELQAVLGIDQSSVSQQLAVLRNKNIVESRKEGTTVYYTVRDTMIFQLLDIARAIFNNHLIDTQAMLQQLTDTVEVV